MSQTSDKEEPHDFVTRLLLARLEQLRAQQADCIELLMRTTARKLGGK